MRPLSISLITVLASTALPAAVFAQSAPACGQNYTVAKGDTLSGIAKRVYGSFVYEGLHQANLKVIGSNPNRIFIGQVLAIPCRNGDTFAAAPAAEPAEIKVADAPVVEVAEPETDVAVVEPAPVAELPQVNPAPEADPNGNLVLTFNRASAPKFVINSGIIDLYLAEISEVTEGRVTFIDPVEVNRDPSEQFELVTSGDVDGAYVFNGHLAGSHPLLQLPMVPLMGGSAEQTAVSMWRLHDEYLSQTDYFEDAELLGFIAAPAAHIWRLTDEPVEVDSMLLESNDYPVPYFRGLDTVGPAVVRAETQEWLADYNETENGTMTFFMAHGAARAAGIWTQERTVTELDNGVYTPTFSVILSNEAWDAISPADQVAIRNVSGERLAARSASWDLFDNGHRSHMIETGLNAIKPEPSFINAVEGVARARLDAWRDIADVMGVPGQEAIDSYRADLRSMQDKILFR